jgi:nicotinate phosphoribosyltransferase
MLSPGSTALFTDLYELTMAASYFAHDMRWPATFELFVRELPPKRGYLVACGLEDALEQLERIRFDDAAISYLASLALFDNTFLEELAEFRFHGEVWAMPEGEVVFAGEPLLRVTAPLIEAQLVETLLLNRIGFDTLVATKARRIADACGGRPFFDFSARRDHGTDAAMRAARAACIGGAAGTSLVLAGARFGLELSGTMAHSYVMSFADEREAFAALARDFPGRATLLLDTYDTEAAAARVVELGEELRRDHAVPFAVRLDSGDLGGLARRVRRILDDGGLGDVRIFASGDLDEHRIAVLVRDGAPVDAFGVGTQLGTGGDAAHLDAVYKLTEDADGPKSKFSEGKATLPGRKQVHRVTERGRDQYDVLALHDEALGEGRGLLERVMVDGRRTRAAPPIAELRERATRATAALAPQVRALEPLDPPYDVRLSPGLRALSAACAATPAPAP